MHAWILLLALVAPIRQPSPAASPSSATTDVSAQVAALVKEYDTARAAFEQKYAAATTDEERQRIFSADMPKIPEYIPRFLALLAPAKGTPAAIDACSWILLHGENERQKAPAYALLEDHAADPRVIGAVSAMTLYSRSLGAERFLRAVLAKSADWETKGQATYSLAQVLSGLAELAASIHSSPSPPAGDAANAMHYGQETIDDLKARDPEELGAESEDLLEDVLAEWKQLKRNGKPLGTTVESELYALRHLAVGKVAPDIVGWDVDGVAFKLSDYRGKVVVLDFWGFW